MLEIGSYAYDKETGQNVMVLECIDLWGYISYKVFDAASGTVYKVGEDRLVADSDNSRCDENYLRFITTLSKIKNEMSDGLLTPISSGIIPLPHQLHALKKALRTNQVRYILADEVGLGKTIEAGMIIEELKARGLVKRVLVVCPTGLVTQWSIEMREKFHEHFQVILPSDYDTIRRLTNSKDVYGTFDYVISPMDSIKPIERHAGWSDEKVEAYNQERIYSIINSGWDLIIIDEAHKIAGSSSEVARYKLGQLLSEASPYLLLLSATPHNGKTEPFLRLIRLLERDAFPNANSVVREQVEPFLIRTEKRDAIDNQGEKLFKNRITHLVSLEWDERHSLQKELYEQVSEYVSKTYGKAVKNRKKNMCLIFLLIIMQRMVTSSTAAIQESLKRRLDVLLNQETKASNLSLEELDEINIEDNVEDALEALSVNSSEEIEELQKIIATARQAMFQYPDVKVEKLVELIDSLRSEDTDQKVIIFTEFVETVRYIKEYLEKQGYRVSTLNGSMSIDERNEAIREFKEDSDVFISTDAGGEGLNLQFANILINYDMPWNPMRVEQRCGRVDRIGQEKDVHIYNFILEGTVEKRVREVIEEKLSVILEEMGIDKYSDVLDSEVAEYDFTDMYIKSIEKPYNIEKNLSSVTMEMKDQMKNVKSYRDVLCEEKNLSELVGIESNFDINDALRMMYTYYQHWNGREVQLLSDMSVQNPQFKEMLNGEYLQAKNDKLLSVSIENFPNEAGYFMLWSLSVAEDESAVKILPVFVNSDFLLRPIAGKRIMDVFLDANSKISCQESLPLSDDQYEKLCEITTTYAYDTFVEIRDKYVGKVKESHNKFEHAWNLRKEAAESIGIDNIKNARLKKLEEEKNVMESEFKREKEIYPELKLILLVKLEA